MRDNAWKAASTDPGTVPDPICPFCHADDGDTCAWDCECDTCEHARERQWADRQDGPTASERASVEREEQIVVYRELKW